MELSQLPNLPIFQSPWFPLILVWGLFWKALALWRSAQKKEKIWFVVLFVVNTFGLLEITYLLLSRED